MSYERIRSCGGRFDDSTCVECLEQIREEKTVVVTGSGLGTG